MYVLKVMLEISSTKRECSIQVAIMFLVVIGCISLHILVCVCFVHAKLDILLPFFVHSLITQVRRKWFAARDALWKEVEGIRLKEHPHLQWYVIVRR